MEAGVQSSIALVIPMPPKLICNVACVQISSVIFIFKIFPTADLSMESDV